MLFECLPFALLTIIIDEVFKQNYKDLFDILFFNCLEDKECNYLKVLF